MKKKILALCLCVAMLAIAIVGGTLAYFTDTDTETNTFTVGNIKIDLVENFQQDSELMPGLDIPKEVYINNVGDNVIPTIGTPLPETEVTAEPDPKKGFIITHRCTKCGAIRRNKAAHEAKVQPDDMKLIIALTAKQI